MDKELNGLRSQWIKSTMDKPFNNYCSQNCAKYQKPVLQPASGWFLIVLFCRGLIVDSILDLVNDLSGFMFGVRHSVAYPILSIFQGFTDIFGSALELLCLFFHLMF